MKEKSKLLRKVIKLQKEEKIIPAGSSLLVALSGGIDSVVLVHVLLELKDFFRLNSVALAHFNHKLREESDREEEFCKQLAKNLGLEIFTRSEDVAQVARVEKKNLEETARELRYSFLRETKTKEGFDLIATAHHLNDLLETALIWFVRGAGMEGLLGFEPREGDIVRPLYYVTRKEIYEFARMEGLVWVEDKSNEDKRFFRNRIRHDVIPLLKELNPNLEETFLRTRNILKEEDSFLKEEALKLLTKSRVENCVEVSKLKDAPVALQRRALIHFTGIRNFSKLEQLRKLLSKGGEVNLGNGFKLVRKGKLMCLKKASL